ncbi:MAG TPA: rod shape-determining protein MreC [Vicinamibacterales bacterium]|nr:rod shape-determining protein MreC [Vicinamibacterales bacterium]
MLDIRQRTGYLFLSVMVGHLILISAQVQSKTGVPVLEAVTFGTFARIQVAVAAVIDGVRNGWGNYVGLRGVRAENEALRRQVAELEVRLQEHRALAARSARLQELMDLRSRTTLPTVAAEVIAGNPNPGMLTVTIDRGAADGVQPNMAVIAPRGVVGRVIGPVAARAARVQLLVDRNAAAGALIERTRVGGMVVGTEDDDPPLLMELVSNLADVKAGDLVVSSGVDGIYPKGFAIGTVESSQEGPRLHRVIGLRPAVDFASLEEVLVVLVPARGATPMDGAPGGEGGQ